VRTRAYAIGKSGKIGQAYRPCRIGNLDAAHAGRGASTAGGERLRPGFGSKTPVGRKRGHLAGKCRRGGSCSMVKAKFRDQVRSKTDTAMKNEFYCKFLCHNICCVIMEQCVLGIEAEFWPKEPGEAPAVLPMVRQ
jgi:hypothetical protein